MKILGTRWELVKVALLYLGTTQLRKDPLGRGEVDQELSLGIILTNCANEGNQAAGMKKPIVMPDSYKGDLDEDWEDWIANFKACAEINEWDDDLKCKFLGVRMKGTALKVYHDLDAGVKTNWNNLCTTLENRFKTVQQPQFYKSRARRNFARPW